MSEILLLNGPAAIGKSRIAETLVRLESASVCIRGDDIRAFAPAHAADFLGGGSTYRAAATLADAYLGMSAVRVVFEYVFEHRRQVDHFVRALQSDVPVHLVTLWAPLEVVRSRDLARERASLGQRIDECHASLYDHLHELGFVVDNSRGEPEVVAKEVHAVMASGRARLVLTR